MLSKFNIPCILMYILRFSYATGFDTHCPIVWYIMHFFTVCSCVYTTFSHLCYINCINCWTCSSPDLAWRICRWILCNQHKIDELSKLGVAIEWKKTKHPFASNNLIFKEKKDNYKLWPLIPHFECIYKKCN